MEEQLMACPFCGEKDFDLVGLKGHLMRSCEAFADIDAPTPLQCLQARMQHKLEDA